jgi:lipoprotein-releasing system permease protein
VSGTPAGGAAPFSRWERAVAFRYLGATRRDGGIALATLISFFAITLAVTGLIAIMSIMNGFRSELLDRILGFNGHVYVAGGVLTGPDRDAAIQRLRAVPGVIQAQPIVEQQVLVQGASLSGAFVRGVTPADLKATEIVAGNIKSGALDGFGDGEYGGDLIAVGARLAEAMGVTAGDPLTLFSPEGGSTPFGSTPRRKTYTLGAVFEVGMSEYDAAFIYMPMEQAQLFFGRGDAVDTLEVRLTDPDAVDRLAPALHRAVGPTGVLSDWRDRNASFFNALRVERTAMRLILMLVVAVVTLTIISGLVMLVRAKTREVAILRTVGATRNSVLRIFLMTGLVIGGLGALTGLILATLFCVYIEPIQGFVEWATGSQVFDPGQYFLSRLPAKMDPGEVAAVMLFSFGMTTAASLIPAWFAARVDPVEALRYE